MIVCQCKGITDRQLRAIVRLGYDSVGRVASACGAGTDCGGCLPTIATIVQQERLLMDCERKRAAEPTREPARERAPEPARAAAPEPAPAPRRR